MNFALKGLMRGLRVRSAQFTVIDVTSTDEALFTVQNSGSGTRFIAGGQDLIGDLNARRISADVLVNLATVPELTGAEHVSGKLEVGAMTRMREIEKFSEDARLSGAGVRYLLAAVAALSGPRAVRTMGTPGGNLVSRRAGTLWPAALTALGGQLRITSQTGTRLLDVPDGIHTVRKAEGSVLVAGFVVSDEQAQLVLGRAPVPIYPYSASATCALVIRPASGIARLALTWPGAVPCVREAKREDFDNSDLPHRLVRQVLEGVSDPEVRRRSRVVMLSLVDRVIARAKNTDDGADNGTVIIDVS